MRLVVRPAQHGKTVDLLRESVRLEAELKAKGGNGCFYVLVATREDAERCARLAREHGIESRFPITVSEARTLPRGGNIRGLLVDDVDRVLPMLLGGMPVPVATLRQDPVAITVTTSMEP